MKIIIDTSSPISDTDKKILELLLDETPAKRYRRRQKQAKNIADNDNPLPSIEKAPKSTKAKSKSTPKSTPAPKPIEPGVVVVQFTNINKKKVTQDVRFISPKHLEELLALNKKLKPSVVSASFANDEDLMAWKVLNYQTLPIVPDDSFSWRDK